MKQSDQHPFSEIIRRQTGALEVFTSISQINISADDLYLSDNVREHLPDHLKRVLDYLSPQTDSPDEFLLMAYIVQLAALIGQKRYVELGGLRFYGVIWMVIFAGSSTMRKSTALNITSKLFKAIENQWNEIYKEEKRQWEQRKREAEKEKQVFDEPEPKRKKLYSNDEYSDLTFLEDLAHSRHQVALASEFTQPLSLWLKPYNNLSDLLLAIFDAPETLIRDTKGGGHIELIHPVYCIAGATTIGNFTSTIPRKHQSSGLLQRIIPVYMESNPKEYKPLTKLPKPDRLEYNQITTELKEISRLSPKGLTLTDEAAELSAEWETALHRESVELEPYLSGLSGYTSRLNTYMLKFAMIFQTLQAPDEPVNRENMKSSILLCEWIYKHIIYMVRHHYVFSRSYSDRMKVLKVLEQAGGRLDRTTLMNRSHLDKDSLDKALENEREAGHIQVIETPTPGGGRPKRAYELI